MKGCFSVCLSFFPSWLCGSWQQLTESLCRRWLPWRGFNNQAGGGASARGGDSTSWEAPLWPCLPLVETQALSRARETNCQLSLGTSCHGTEVWDEEHQVPAAGDQPLCHGKQAGLGGSLQNRGELLPFPSPLWEEMVFPRSVFGGWRASTTNCLGYHCTMGSYLWPPASLPLLW